MRNLDQLVKAVDGRQDESGLTEWVLNLTHEEFDDLTETVMGPQGATQRWRRDFQRLLYERFGTVPPIVTTMVLRTFPERRREVLR